MRRQRKHTLRFTTNGATRKVRPGDILEIELEAFSEAPGMRARSMVAVKFDWDGRELKERKS